MSSMKLCFDDEIDFDWWNLRNVVVNMFIISSRCEFVKFDRSVTPSSLIDELFVKFDEFVITSTNLAFLCSNDFFVSKSCSKKSNPNSILDMTKTVESDVECCCPWISMKTSSLLNVSVPFDWNCKSWFDKRKRIETKSDKSDVTLFLSKKLNKSTFFSKTTIVFLKNDLSIAQFVKKSEPSEIPRVIIVNENRILNDEISFESDSVFSRNSNVVKTIKSI